MAYDLDVLTVLCCDWHPRIKVTKQLFYWLEASYAKANCFTKYLAYGEVLSRSDNF